MKAPFVLKLSFYQPSIKNGQKNSKHIQYIGTRPGVSFDKSQYEFEQDSASGHIKYANERPGSHGLFSDNEDQPINLKEIQEELLNHDGNVWRMIISLREDDAQELGFLERKSWENLVNSSVYDVANEMKIPSSNLRWVAAFHEEKGHPHVHLVLWENEAKRERGKLSPAEHKKVRQIFARDIYASERERLSQVKTAERDYIRDFAKDDITKVVRLYKDLNFNMDELTKEIEDNKVGLHPRLRTPELKVLLSKIHELSEIIPEKGRLSYALMPEQIKQKLDDVSNWLINKPEFNDSLSNYINSIEQLTRMHTSNKESIQNAIDKSLHDLQKRVSQVLLKGAKEFKNEFRPIVDEKKTEKALRALSNAKRGPVEQNIPLLVTKKVIASLRMQDYTNNEIKDVFQKWAMTTDLKVTDEQINHLLNHRSEHLEANTNQIASILKLAGFENDSIINRLNGDRQEFLNLFNKVTQKTNEEYISVKEWSQLTKYFDKKVAYPYSNETTFELKGPPSELIEKLTKSRPQELVEEEDIGWAAFCMTVVLKHTNVAKDERVQLVNDWLENLQAPRPQSINLEKMNKSIEDGGMFLKEKTWQFLMNTLEIKDTDYPFNIYQNMVLDKEKLANAIEQFKMTTPANNQLDSEILNVYAKLLKNFHHNDKAEFKQEFLLRAKDLGATTQQVDKLLGNFERRTKDIDFLRTSFGIRDIAKDTLRDYASVLLVAGKNPEEAISIISNWNNRIGNKFDFESINQTVDSVSKMHQENQVWGKATFVNKQRYDSLLSNLGVKAPYIYNFPNNMSLPLLNNIWKTVWKEIEKENTRSNAQAQHMQRERLKREKQNRHDRER